MRIMTVCLGNICRSPAAEAVLLHKLAEAGLDGEVTVTSAGTADYHVGEQPHRLTREVGGELGYRFDTLGAQFTLADLEATDLVLVMDESNYEDVVALTEDETLREKVHLMGEFASTVDTAGVLEVPDPWSLPRDAFEQMYEQLEDCADGVVAALRSGDL